MNQYLIDKAIEKYIEKVDMASTTYAEAMQDRSNRLEYYQAFDANKIREMDTDAFYEYIGKLWSMLIWGNKKYVVDKMILDNGFEILKEWLCELLYGTENIQDRWDKFLKNAKGFGPATMSELLTYANPDEYVIFNQTTIKCFKYFEIPDMPKYNYQYTGKKYVEVCGIAKEIAEHLRGKGLENVSLLTIDYFLWDEVLPLTEKEDGSGPTSVPTPHQETTSENVQSVHDELIEKILQIGTLLGFKSMSEVPIRHGAIVDAVWEVSVGNMGKVIYVFEVQSRGSIDSLVMNLKKAQSNPAVQAIVAVSSIEQLEKIKKESEGVIDGNALRMWESDDVIAVHDALVRAHESINKLALVPESFSRR